MSESHNRKTRPLQVAGTFRFCLLAIPVLIGCQSRFHDALTRDAIPGWEVRNGAPEAWTVQDGVLACDGAGKLWGSWIGTREEYTDFVVELEYKVSPGANSGVLLRVPPEGHPSNVALEVQILDDNAEAYRKFRPDQYTGSLYKLVAPSRRVTRPANQWNNLRITARADHITIELNHHKIIDVDGKKCPELLNRSARGAIGLQNHHTQVWFRNIRIADLASGQERNAR